MSRISTFDAAGVSEAARKPARREKTPRAKRPPATGLLAYAELLKPITWFAPMWAFGCGLVSSGRPLHGHLWLILAGIALCGPLVTGMSQVVNDWYDRHVDAINEPGRAIPSGRVPGHGGLMMAGLWTFLSLGLAAWIGVWAFAATVLGVALAWAYSAPPFRIKLNGWWGNAACGACYEGLPWFTAATIMQDGLPSTPIILAAALYSLGAHGIMTLNDFKSIEGDRQMGIRSLPVMLGAPVAARLACVVMAAPQLVVIALLLHWHFVPAAFLVGALLAAQGALMITFLGAPREKAPWYNATGTTLFVIGMQVTAVALRGMAG